MAVVVIERLAASFVKQCCLMVGLLSTVRDLLPVRASRSLCLREFGASSVCSSTISDIFPSALITATSSSALTIAAASIAAAAATFVVFFSDAFFFSLCLSFYGDLNVQEPRGLSGGRL